MKNLNYKKLILLTFLLLGLTGVLLGSLSIFSNLTLRSQGHSAKAIITNFKSSNGTDPGEISIPSRYFYIEATYPVDGKPLQGTSVSCGRIHNEKIGDSIAIRYKDHSPELFETEEMISNNLFSGIITLLIGLIVAIIVMIIYKRWK